MYTVKVIRKTDNRTMEEVFECGHYKRELLNENKEDFQHYLELYNLPSSESTVKINLYEMAEDEHGKYDQTVYIMNGEGKTIDRF